MAVERISKATVVDLKNGIIQTDEADLLTDGKILSPLVHGTPTERRLVTKFVGEKNYDYFINETYDINEKKLSSVTIPERVTYIDGMADWYRHVLGRELAARSLEMSQLMDVSILKLVNPMMELTEGTKYDRMGVLRPFKSGIVQLGQYAKSAVREEVNMGDLLARERVYREHVLMQETGLLARELMKSSAKKLSIGQEKERARRHARTQANANLDGALKTETLFILETEPLIRTRDTMLPPELREALDVAQAMRTFLWDARSKKDGRALFTNPETWYNFQPSNADLYDTVNAQTPGKEEPEDRESIQLVQLSPEEEALAKARLEARQRELEERQAAQIKAAEEERRAIEAHNEPILAELARIKAEYDDLLGAFLNHSKRELRSIGIIGSNSLSYNLSHLKGQDIDSADRLARIYDYLRRNATNDMEAAKEELSAVLVRLEELRAKYQAYMNEHPLRNGAASRVDRLGESVKPELAWLTAHWDEFKDQLDTSAHSRHITRQQLEDIARMLGVESPEAARAESVQVSDEDDISDDTMLDETENDDAKPLLESPLIQANRLAEQLNWIVLPDEKITAGQLVDIAREATKRRSKDGKPAEVEHYRMEALLELRKEFGGTLYRSDERTLDDTDNLYFVLRFQHPGDDNFYAVAENPVYGNATYVLREDVLPLMPGESVLSAVKLSRRDVRSLGAKRIIHGTPDKDIHLEKVNGKIVALSTQDSLVSA